MELYRQEMNLPGAKLILVSKPIQSRVILNPTDPNLLAINGYSDKIQDLINQFIVGY